MAAKDKDAAEKAEADDVKADDAKTEEAPPLRRLEEKRAEDSFPKPLSKPVAGEIKEVDDKRGSSLPGPAPAKPAPSIELEKK